MTNVITLFSYFANFLIIHFPKAFLLDTDLHMAVTCILPAFMASFYHVTDMITARCRYARETGTKADCSQ